MHVIKNLYLVLFFQHAIKRTKILYIYIIYIYKIYMYNIYIYIYFLVLQIVFFNSQYNQGIKSISSVSKQGFKDEIKN